MLPRPRIQTVVSRRDSAPADPQQRPERVERVEPPVKPESIFVEVCLQVLRADSVMTAEQPAFQIGEHQMDNRQVGFSHRGVA